MMTATNTETDLLASIRLLPERRRELIESAVRFMVARDGEDFRVKVTLTHEGEGIERILFE
jgi:hypothetical protein